MCDNEHMLRPDQLRLAIQALVGPSAASRRLGCGDSLVHHWLTGRRLISAEKAWRLRDLMIALSGTLPGVAYDLKVAAHQAGNAADAVAGAAPAVAAGGRRQAATFGARTERTQAATA